MVLQPQLPDDFLNRQPSMRTRCHFLDIKPESEILGITVDIDYLDAAPEIAKQRHGAGKADGPASKAR